MFKKITISLLLLTSFAFSDNEPNNTCSEAELIEEMDNLSQGNSHTEEGTAIKSSDKYDYYKINIKEDGRMKVDFKGDKSTNAIYIGESCSNISSIYSNSTSTTSIKSKTFDVSSGQIIYIKIKRDYNTLMNYTLKTTYAYGDDPLADSNFELKMFVNLKGGVRVVGNTVETGNESTSNNSQIKMKYVDVDNDSDTFNSSWAKIEDTISGVSVKDAKIKWAGLFWQGSMHNDNKDSGGDDEFNDFSQSSGSTAETQILNLLNTHKIKFTLGTGEVLETAADDINYIVARSSSKHRTIRYGAFVNITDFLKDKAPNNKYTFANLPTRAGKSYSGNDYDGTGLYGAWTLVVVYENEDEPAEKTRNVSVFSGYQELRQSGVNHTIIGLSGFKTPKNAPNGVDSTISIFAGEGDRQITGDYAKIINQDNYTYKLPNSPGTTNYFASSIEGVPLREPKIINNAGIDIHTTKIGTSEGSDRPIKINQTRAFLEIGTSGDTFMPSLVVFSTELYTPKLCYDYDVRLGETIQLPTNDREIDTSAYGKNLQIKALIRSEESDFPLQNVKYRIVFHPDNENDALKYMLGTSFVSPPEVNAYYSVPDLDSQGTIALGTLNADRTIGTIDALESSYAKQKFQFLTGKFKGTFDIEVESDIVFDPNSPSVHYKMSTRGEGNNVIPRCDTNAVYSPIWGEYNIERSDAPTTGADYEKYPLYTQVAGKPFSIAVRRYSFDNATQKYDKPKIVKSNIELEMIDASLFENNADNGYDSSCEEPDKIGNSTFIKMNNTSKQIVNIPAAISGFDNDAAYKNVAFRIWYLGYYDDNKNFTVLDHECTVDGGDCFKDLYKDYIKDQDQNNVCKEDCETEYGASQCYSCLKINFAKPVCSRDNFAIRPDKFNIKISDGENGLTGSIFLAKNEKNSDETVIASEYQYDIDISAMQANSLIAKNYYKYNYKKEILDSIDDNKERILLESKNKAQCYDKNHYTYDYSFIDSKIYDKAKFTHTNVGEYEFSLFDNTWTEVDQASYRYKNSFDGVKTNDCVLNSGDSSGVKVGCDIKSVRNDGFIDNTPIKVKFNPYSYSFDEIIMETLPDGKTKVFMDDLSNTYYGTNDVTTGTKVSGKLAAVGKNGTVLTNYTENCYAEDVKLKINRDTLPTAEEDLTSTRRGVSQKDVFFQQLLKLEDTNEIAEGKDEEVTLVKGQFNEDSSATNTDAGKGDVELYLTFKKPLRRLVLPIRVTINEVDAYSEDAKSTADKDDNFVPSGKNEYDKTIDYLFAKVTPSRKLYGPTVEDDMATPLFVDIYCLDRPGLTCGGDLGLLNHTRGQDENIIPWYSADIFTTAELGNTDVSVRTVLGEDAEPTVLSTDVNRNTNVPFNDAGAAQNDIEVRLAGDARPSSVEVTVKPVPFLLYDMDNANGYPTYKVNFIGQTVWTGAGKTGKTVTSQANSVPTKRMHW